MVYDRFLLHFSSVGFQGIAGNQYFCNGYRDAVQFTALRNKGCGFDEKRLNSRYRSDTPVGHASPSR